MHRMASWNEESGRYSELSSDFYVPDADQWRINTAANKQATVAGNFTPEQKDMLYQALTRHQEEAYELYKALLHDPSSGDEEPDWDRVFNDALAGLPPLARELARMVLPVSIYTRWVWKIDLKNLFHFLKLRLDGHAQHEIQVYGQVIDKFVETLCPAARSSWLDNDVNSLHLSESDTTVLQAILSSSLSTEIYQTCRLFGWSKRRFGEFREKANRLFQHKPSLLRVVESVEAVYVSEGKK